MNTSFSKRLLLPALLLAVSVSTGQITMAQDEQGGTSGSSSPGYEGDPDTEAAAQAAVRKAEKKGKRSQAYIASLLGLGMHYNRANRFADATRVLRQALAIVDSGALKPTPASKRVPDKIIEKQQGDVVSAEIVTQSMPYEEMISELLPQLITAEIGANDLKMAEAHVKRLLIFTDTNPVKESMNRMSAYMNYAEICRKLHRTKEAHMYQKKADEINASFKPL